MKKRALIWLAAGLLAGGCSREQPAEGPATTSGGSTTATTSTDGATASTDKGGGETGKLVTSTSGLKYVDLVVGKGDTPNPGQKVVVHYTGTLADGTKFDSSHDRNQPFDFVLGSGGVIAGWEEGVATMKPGGKRKLIIPPDLGYGAMGQGPIPPNATLNFVVELLRVE